MKPLFLILVLGVSGLSQADSELISAQARALSNACIADTDNFDKLLIDYAQIKDLDDKGDKTAGSLAAGCSVRILRGMSNTYDMFEGYPKSETFKGYIANLKKIESLSSQYPDSMAQLAMSIQTVWEDKYLQRIYNQVSVLTEKVSSNLDTTNNAELFFMTLSFVSPESKVALYISSYFKGFSESLAAAHSLAPALALGAGGIGTSLSLAEFKPDDKFLPAPATIVNLLVPQKQVDIFNEEKTELERQATHNVLFATDALMLAQVLKFSGEAVRAQYLLLVPLIQWKQDMEKKNLENMASTVDAELNLAKKAKTYFQTFNEYHSSIDSADLRLKFIGSAVQMASAFNTTFFAYNREAFYLQNKREISIKKGELKRDEAQRQYKEAIKRLGNPPIFKARIDTSIYTLLARKELLSFNQAQADGKSIVEWPIKIRNKMIEEIRAFSDSLHITNRAPIAVMQDKWADFQKFVAQRLLIDQKKLRNEYFEVVNSKKPIQMNTYNLVAQVWASLALSQDPFINTTITPRIYQRLLNYVNMDGEKDVF